MGEFKRIEQKLEAFMRRYYLNRLIKGMLLFLAIGLLYFLLNILIEHFLWLGTTGRRLLFWSFLIVEIFLFGIFILKPILELFKLREGISRHRAAEIIGTHFPEVNDKLTNLLQLRENSRQSELLLAGIEQKSAELSPIPFSRAVDFKKNSKYIKYAAFPIILILAFILSGQASLLTGPSERFFNYNKEYTAPAVFSFLILNDELKVREGEEFLLQVETMGKLIPEEVSLKFKGQNYFMRKTSTGKFEYNFTGLKSDLDFELNANNVSLENRIEVVKVPRILDMQMHLDYPAYTARTNEVLNSTGNAVIPEGTKITWRFKSLNAQKLHLKFSDSLLQLPVEYDSLDYSRNIYRDAAYSISASNSQIDDYEPVNYLLSVIPDERPEIEVIKKVDSLDGESLYFYGKLSDDYAISLLELRYFPESNPEGENKVKIPVSKSSLAEFYRDFPGILEVEAGQAYQVYFRVWDNDGVNGAKYKDSEVFSYRKKTRAEVETENLQRQGESIQGIQERLEKMKTSEEQLGEISRFQKESGELNYNQRQKLRDFLERQKQQNEIMKNYSEKLKQSFEEERIEPENKELNQELKRRLEKNEKELKEQEELLRQLEELANKLEKEELGRKLDELSKKNRSGERNLEQLLEITKRYYVEEKLQKLARDLDELGKKQEDLGSNEENNSVEKQQEINEKFQEFKEAMDQLEKDNEDLKEPKELGRDSIDEESIEKEMQEAEQKLQEDKKKEAGENQKEAGEQMQEMAKKMQQSSQQQSMQQLEADIGSLRQILDNLVSFSFNQEDLLLEFREMRRENPAYAAALRQQNTLREHFEHIDDSLYALAMKNPFINEEITKNLTDIEFDLEQAIERLSDNEVPQGTASQQYVVTGANNLAYLLSNILGNMQQQMNMNPGQGGEQEFQLPDIIQQQQELEEQFREGLEKHGEGKPKEEGGGEEQMNSDLFEIYKQQQELRRRLEELNKKDGSGEKTGDLERKMQQLEEQLLEKSFDPDLLENFQDLQHELLKFEEAEKQQGQDDRREATTNFEEFNKSSQDQLLKAKEYFNSTEILNRQILPLRPNYKRKVKEYFERTED